MRININLASQKYEDAREFYIRWGGTLAVVAVTAVVLALLVWSNYKATAIDMARIRDLREKIALRDKERQEAQDILNDPRNRDVRDQSQFWNGVIDQKAFSWTQLFSDLEKIMPARVYVINAVPTITNERRLKLLLTFVGEKFDNANELLSKMEHSERFRLPELVSTGPHKQESATGTPPGYQFEIVAYYAPALPKPQPQAATAKKGA